MSDDRTIRNTRHKWVIESQDRDNDEWETWQELPGGTPVEDVQAKLETLRTDYPQYSPYRLVRRTITTVTNDTYLPA